MSHQHAHQEQGRIVEIDGKDIAKVDLMEPLHPVSDLLYKTTRYLFASGRFTVNAPFKGFLLYGPVGTGKTELVKQVTRRLAYDMQDKAVVKLIPVDSAVIASPRWGESEQVFNEIFSHVKELRRQTINPKVVILFDDIESLMLARGMSAAREWHYSLNSVLFHLVDNLNPSETMIFATTNRLDLMDIAIKTRLYSVEVPAVPMETLMEAAQKLLDSMLGPEKSKDKDKVLKDVESRLRALEHPNIRDTRQFTIMSCIELGALSE
ncbi:MAG: AAA family ATPase [Thaumarchaeota archaeon]|nr:AAA family ATPase [Nitrososphaerota archaeon]